MPSGISQSLLLLHDSASLRAIPEIREKYQIDYPKEHVASRFREEWERNRSVRDTAMIDLLVFKGWAELDEAKFLWKQRPHVMAFMNATTKKPEPEHANKEFLKRFLAGQEIEY